MARAVFRKIFAIAALSLTLSAAPAAAQLYSDGYEFLKAVKDRDGDKVTQALNEPGSVIVNTRDITSGESALHIVTKRRDVTWIKFLAQRGANPNIRDKNGVTPLQIASSLGFIDGVDALIAAGADVDESNTAGETPLIAAVHRRDTALVRLLLSKGANPDRSDNSGRTARDYVQLVNGNSQLLKEFEDADAERASAKEVKNYGPIL
ncbi:ankyrin repeat domain-containing protein [Altererythrobacter luteolus]|uniref:Ankyrin repeat domain-containing protein n=1 Tax=Pontixanthobacter luteolus TaxID=295089 RepID=A0A6I4V2N6_9SPHN|nr:ankyrin repeat domain-containing protein [Pontixanthobacter luteolus]MXP48447.1 ankyrin repeat domain-containing protein [Pontixanthobacter luteolus]